jgi:hypothetical protein
MVSRATLTTGLFLDGGTGPQQFSDLTARWAPASNLLNGQRQQVTCTALSETTVPIPDGAVFVQINAFQQSGLALLFGSGETSWALGTSGVPLILPVGSATEFLLGNSTIADLQVEVLFA